jgi:hypothetical protein
MKRILFISIILISFLSCSIYREDRNDCKHKVAKSLRDIAKYISMNKETKVYTLDYTKLPEFDRTMHQMIIDSLENMFIFPPNDSLIKHTIFSKKLRSITNISCEIKYEDIIRYFGLASELGTKNEIVHSIFYWFNPLGNIDCYTKDSEFGPHNGCSLLIFKINKSQILTEVITDHF